MDRLFALFRSDHMAVIELSKERKQILIDSIKNFFIEEHDEDISDFKAEIYLDFILNHAGVYIYEQAIADAHEFMLEKADELFTLEKRIVK